MKTPFFIAGYVIGVLGILAGFYLAVIHLLVWGWNIALVPLFHAHVLHVWEASGLIMLLTIVILFLNSARLANSYAQDKTSIK